MKKVGIVMGSASDMPVVKKAIDTLEAFGIPYEVLYDDVYPKFFILSYSSSTLSTINPI